MVFPLAPHSCSEILFHFIQLFHHFGCEQFYWILVQVWKTFPLSSLDVIIHLLHVTLFLHHLKPMTHGCHALLFTLGRHPSIFDIMCYFLTLFWLHISLVSSPLNLFVCWAFPSIVCLSIAQGNSKRKKRRILPLFSKC